MREVNLTKKESFQQERQPLAPGDRELALGEVEIQPERKAEIRPERKEWEER